MTAWYYLPKLGTLAVHKSLVLSLDSLELLSFFRAQLVLHNKAQESVVWSMSCLQ